MSNKKYTKEEEAFIVEEYQHSPTKETVTFLAEKLEVSPRSIIGKLSRLGVYQKEAYTPKYAEKPISKEELVLQIANLLDLDVEALEGLAKSQKPALLYMANALQSKQYQEEDARVHASTYSKD